ncbi:MmcQ/YjbR family DNA-binding protein [Vibrio rumoiensis]|uniref:MmcQ/YjbR family DNA-binding protein n=1 Tax=Vibrio rumoiensis 1S-45 TaxID=1188252 RepID=A0A1E5E1J7_9VIBR|nr:MmcQ/YjbR family DNA-binding protein [Vibrio rumoiensis]OEF24133.1 hypothetical protein A1QC_10850 [Vibrio rumoiensis 1S-45]
MTFEEFNQFCGSFAASTHVIQWGNSHVWKVGGKVFAIGSQHNTKQPAYTFKTSPLNFEFLSDHQGYKPAPYLASRGFKWIQQVDSSDERSEELEYYLTESYRLVVSGLSKVKRKALGLEGMD